MKKHTPYRFTMVVVLCSSAAVARAQPASPVPPDDPVSPEAAAPTADQPADPWAEPPSESKRDDANKRVDNNTAAAAAGNATLSPQPISGDNSFQRAVLRPRRAVKMPVMFNAPTGYLLPAGVILGSVGLDTGGGVATDTRIGLGDVAEFGFGTSDQIRVVSCNGGTCGDAEAVQPYWLAQFKMGLAEDRLFRNQPGIAIGFRKSFSRKHDRRSTRVAELYVVASKQLGPSAKIHAGGVFWDAGVKRNDSDDEVLFHTRGVSKQLRAFGGVELQPLPRSTLMLEVSWAPEFQLQETTAAADSIKLRPAFSLGVRYEFTKWGVFESGVRIPNIKDMNLLDAQIFGQLRIVSSRFANFLEGLR